MPWMAQYTDEDWPLGGGRVPDTHRHWVEPGSGLEAGYRLAGYVEVEPPTEPTEPTETGETGEGRAASTRGRKR